MLPLSASVPTIEGLLAKNAPNAILCVSSQGTINYYHGRDPKPSSLVGRHVRDLTLPEHWPMVQASYQRLFDSGKPEQYEYRYANPEGQLVYLHIYKFLVQAHQDQPATAMVVSTDVTAQRLNYQQKEAAWQNLLGMINQGWQSMLMLDPEGRIVLANQRLVERFRYLYQLNLEVGRHFNEYFETEEMKGQFAHYFNEAIEFKQNLRFEHLWPTDAKGRVRWFDVSFTPVVDSQGQVLGVVIGQIEITERKEEHSHWQQMNQALIEKNTQLSHYSHVVSHNLRAPVASLLGLINVMELQGLVNDDNRELLNLIRNSAQGLDTVVRDLNQILAETWAKDEQKLWVDFAQEVDLVKALLGQPILTQQVTIHTDFTEVAGLVSTRSYLSSIFYNLIGNAIKYQHPGRPPVITVSSKRLPERPNCLVITFSDNCLGMDLATQGDHLFKLYQRFHHHVDGKGMGLYLVKTQVEMLGGKIEVESQVNQGTQFHVYLKEK
ncbi:MAG: PAS domain-containing protein [Bernardetiaceae bacterium]|jgi:hypothetical protein|nr:PAS domain-containing protein [Bernardetiaceae bacterium]